MREITDISDLGKARRGGGGYLLIYAPDRPAPQRFAIHDVDCSSINGIARQRKHYLIHHSSSVNSAWRQAREKADELDAAGSVRICESCLPREPGSGGGGPGDGWKPSLQD